jgi:hypothetical protein
MSYTDETFFTAVGCMDGRVQEPVAKFGQKRFDGRYPDTITEAGLVKKLGRDVPDPVLKEKIRFKVVDVSIGKHHSKGIIVHGHQECAGNPVDDNQHREDVRRSVNFIKQLVNDAVPVIGVFITRGHTDWEVEELSETVLV